MTIPRKTYFPKVLIFISIVILLVINSVQPVAALSPAQKRTFDAGNGYFDVAVSTACGGNANLTGSDNAEKVFNFFISQKLEPFMAAGIMGNMKAEAHFEPRLVEYGWKNSRGEVSYPGQPSSLDDSVPPDQNKKGQPGYGIIQWTSPDRKQGLKDIVAKNNVKASDLATQLEYVMQELNGSYKDSTYTPLLASTDVDQATDIILENYERPGNIPEQRPIRRGFARDLLAQFGSGSSGTVSPSATTCGTDESGEVIDNYSLPVARKWYDQHKDWFTKPHHDYPAADIPVPTGTWVYSMTAGKVVSAPTGGGYGQGVIIDAGNGVRFTYGHGSDGGSIPGAKEGDQVQAGQKIMHSASTGRSSGPHLHLEIEINGQNFCPQSLFVGIVEGNIPDIASLPTSGCTYKSKK